MSEFSVPIFLAPMAGGPSTPELCASVSNTGGIGFLAAGYLSPQRLQADVERARKLTVKPFGVNLFVQQPRGEEQVTSQKWSEYRHFLLDVLPQQYSELLPSRPQYSDDSYDEKFDYLLDAPIEYVSFTFGYPGDEAIDLLHKHGKKVIVNTTTLAGGFFSCQY